MFHELAESYDRTTNKMPYERPNGTGAHDYAIKREGYLYGNYNPGNGRFKSK